MQLIAKYLLIAVLLATFYPNTTHASGDKNNFLSKEQIRLLDMRVSSSIPECRFLYTKSSSKSIKKETVYKCIERFNTWFWAEGNYKILEIPDEKINHFLLLDDYLGEKIVPYIRRLNKTDQAKLLRKIVAFHTEDLNFIQTMLNNGVSVKQVLLQQLGDGGAWASCEAYTIFLNSNIALYQDDRTLYEPVPDMNEAKIIAPSYRWEDFHHLTNPTYNICPKVIDRLARANPELLNKKSRSDGLTPLHLYLSGAFMKNLRDMLLVEKLITPININMQSNKGDTPLHLLLTNTNIISMTNKRQVIKLMIKRGAKINIQNKKGITAKNLILKSKDLTEVLYSNH